MATNERQKHLFSDRKKILFYLMIIYCFSVLFQACAPAKYIPEGQYLLDKNKIRIDQENEIRKHNIHKQDIRGYIHQQPNARIFGFRFNLWLYNLSNPEKDNWINKWLRRVGDEPVILDTIGILKSSDQITTYLQTHGYFNTVVNDSVIKRKKRAKVIFSVYPDKPYLVNRINYNINDSVLAPLILEDTLNSLVKKGQPFEVDVLKNERKRLEKVLRDSGFYAFSRENIRFLADSSIGRQRVNLSLIIEPVRAGKRTSDINVRYRIRNVYFFVDYDPQSSLKNPVTYYAALDTLFEDGYYYVSESRPAFVKRKVIRQANYIRPGSGYSLQNVELTRKHLSGLKVYKFINIYFTPAGNHEAGERIIDCHIQLSPVMQQSYAIEVEGTNSSGNLGGALNLQYQHRNLFHGAEIFRINLKQSIEALAQEQRGIKQIIGSAVETELTLPQFLFPVINTERFIKKYNPKTNISFSYNYQRRPDYTRTIFAGLMGYNWMSSKYVSHIVSPLNINAVHLSYIDPSFLAHLDTTTYLAFSYRDVFIPAGSYSYIYDNQRLGRTTDRLYMRFNAEFAGNLLHGVYKLFNAQADSLGSYHILGLQFAQYVKTDFDIRYTAVINDANSVVFRGFAGIGIPYLNSRALPFEKQYYAGGANGIRAWQVRSLGPGSYVVKNTRFYNQTADMKLEANMEYRFKLFWVLEGALFLDAGNIWAVNREDDRAGALFRLNTFMDDIALGTGLGARFDFNYFLFRIDLGMKLRDPSIQEGSRWIYASRPYHFSRDFAVQVGIGYPF
ncbi:MAG: BamA/TamA family outer membrane protein [Chlorobi bacterium]|nr:BamA/TamA family outer membrane protein [Chlorobiota bacterium]